MNLLTFSLIKSITQVDKSIINKIKIVGGEEYIGIESFDQFLNKCFENRENILRLLRYDNNVLISIIIFSQTEMLIDFLRLMCDTDIDRVVRLISHINKYAVGSGADARYAKLAANRLFLLYRLSELPEIFSTDKFVLISKSIESDL